MATYRSSASLSASDTPVNSRAQAERNAIIPKSNRPIPSNLDKLSWIDLHIENVNRFSKRKSLVYELEMIYDFTIGSDGQFNNRYGLVPYLITRQVYQTDTMFLLIDGSIVLSKQYLHRRAKSLEAVYSFNRDDRFIIYPGEVYGIVERSDKEYKIFQDIIKSYKFNKRQQSLSSRSPRSLASLTSPINPVKRHRSSPRNKMLKDFNH